MASSNRCTPGTAKTATTAVSAPFPTGDHFPLVKIDGASRGSRRAVDLYVAAGARFLYRSSKISLDRIQAGAKGLAGAAQR